jgi:hypothetical protein
MTESFYEYWERVAREEEEYRQAMIIRLGIKQ